MTWLRRIAVYLLVALLGFALGCVLILIVQVRGRPALALWHTVELETEYHVDGPNAVESFPEYLALEERLFAELDERVYAHTPTGPRYALARYSRGSIADPHRFPVNWNASFELPAASPRGGVLLVHGMSDAPYSLRALGEAMHARGHYVVGVRLPGHGTAPSGLATATWEDMAGAVALAAQHLGEKVGDAPVHLVGYSTGAPLAIDYALSVKDGAPGPRPESLVLVSPAVAISPAAAGARWLRTFSKLPGLEQLAWTQVLPEFDPFKYNSFAVNAGDQVHRLTQRLVADLEARASEGPIDPFPRTLVFLSTVDATVSADAVIDNLLVHLAPHRHELVLFDVNRCEVKASLLVSDPGPLTERLIADPALPFSLTLLKNARPDGPEIAMLRKAPFLETASREETALRWPVGVVSLSHVALPFPLDDPLYGSLPPGSEDVLHLGHIAFQGERGLLKIPTDWLMRLRHNPFYDYVEQRSLDWVEAAAPERP